MIMKILSKRISLILILIISIVILPSCSGQVGNTDISNYEKPVCQYRLINSNASYELIAIDEEYFGFCWVDYQYNSLNNRYGYLPITSINSAAFANNNRLLYIIILSNVTYIDARAFDGWKKYQKIYFQINEEDTYGAKYNFHYRWNEGCEAEIIWGAKLSDFGLSIHDILK